MSKNLEENFRLAHRWGCVLLLDEADVFLAKRDRENLKRNSLVSSMDFPGHLPILGTNPHATSLSESARVLSWHPIPYNQPGRDFR